MTRTLLASTAAATLLAFGAAAQSATLPEDADLTDLTTYELNVLAEAAVEAQAPDPLPETHMSERTYDQDQNREMDADTTVVSTGTIVVVAVQDGRFETLNWLLEESGLDETLSQEGPYTVFAPTDAAFERLDDTTLDVLRKEPDRREEVLRAHVLDGRLTTDDFTEAGSEYDTIGRAVVTVAVDEAGDITFDEGVVTAANIEASNGVIHVIDKVLIPEHPDWTFDMIQDDF